MNTKSSMKSLLYRAATVFMIATMLFAAMPVNPINAAAVTYNFQPDTGTTVATGVVTNDADCATSSKVTTTTLMNMDAFGCTSHIIGPTTSGAQTILNVWFNTAFTSDTTVTGTSLKIRLREFSTAGGTATPWTAGIMLMYVNASGTITDFTGTEVTQVVEDASDANYTFSLTDQSATVPSGSKLGIRIRAIESTSTNMRVYYGSTASTIGGTSGVLIVDEKQVTTLTVAAATGTYAGTTDLLATLTDSEGSPISGETISFTLNGSSVGSIATDASGVASLTGISLTGVNAGNYPTGVAASFAGDTNYVASTGTNSLDVSKATPTLSVTNSPVIYNGSPQAATVVGSVAGVVSDIQYDGSATVPTNATTYTVIADFVPTDTTNYNSLTDASAGDFVIDKATPTLSVTNSPVTYNGSAQAATVVGSVAGVVSDIQYDASAIVPTNAGTYAVTADFLPTDTLNYNSLSDASAGDFVINKATPTLSVTNSPVIYNGSPQAATVVGSVAGVVSDIQYDGSATVPTNATTYTVTADFVPTDTINYNSLSDASAGDFVIDKATPTISVTNSPITYNGSPQAATVAGSVAGVVSDIQYDGSPTTPTNTGTYAVTADFVPTDTLNYNSLTDASAGDFVIDKATPTLSVTNSPVGYTGSPQAATVVGSVDGVVSDIQYDGASTIPADIGTYAVTADFVPTDMANYNSLSDASAGNFVIGDADLAIVDVNIAGNTVGDDIEIPLDSGDRYGFAGVDNGPAAVVSTNGVDIITALRVIWQEPAAGRTSYSEMMGLPVEQLSSEYWFPWYNNVDTTVMSQGFRFANVDSTQTTIKVMLGATELDSFTLQPSESVRVNYAVNDAPIQIYSEGGEDILAALRVIWTAPVHGRYSYSEMMGLPAEQLSSEYWFPWYNNLDTTSMTQGFRIASVNGSGDNTVEVYVGGALQESFTLAAGASVRVNYPVNDGPVRVVCTTCSGAEKIITSLRVIWPELGCRDSYSEMMGLPPEQLSSEYWLPWYNNVDTTAMTQGLRIASVNGTGDNTVQVWVGNSMQDSLTLAAGASVRVNYAVNAGPIRIVCTTCSGDEKIISSLRVIWQETIVGRTSYSEMMALPDHALSTTYWFPWYNNAATNSMNQGFRISVP